MVEGRSLALGIFYLWCNNFLGVLLFLFLPLLLDLYALPTVSCCSGLTFRMLRSVIGCGTLWRRKFYTLSADRLRYDFLRIYSPFSCLDFFFFLSSTTAPSSWTILGEFREMGWKAEVKGWTGDPVTCDHIGVQLCFRSPLPFNPIHNDV